MILMALAVPSAAAAAGRLMANTCRHRTPQSTLTTTFHSPTFNLHAENAATFTNNNNNPKGGRGKKVGMVTGEKKQGNPIP